MVKFAERLAVGMGANRVIAEQVTALRQRGIPVIDAGQGSPTAPQDDNVTVERVLEAVRALTRYAVTDGAEEHRRAVELYLNELISARQPELNPGFRANQIAFTVGGSGGVFLASMLVGEPGTRILIPRPGYSNYPGPVTFTDAKLGYYKTHRKRDYVPTYEDLKKAVDPKGTGKTDVRAILLNFPGNPTGATLNRKKAEELGKTINKLVMEYPDLMIVNDMAYLGIARDGENFSFYPFLSKQAKMATVNVMSASKDASQANDRTGYIASINPDIIKNTKVLSAGTTMGIVGVGTAGFAEFAHLAGQIPNFNDTAINHYQTRLKIIADGLNEIAQKVKPGHKVGEVPGGGVFFYADFSHLRGKPVPQKFRKIVGHNTIESSEDIAKILLNLHEIGYAPVGTIHGEGFGDAPGKCCLRIAGIESPELLKQLVESFKGMTQEVTGHPLGAVGNLNRTKQILRRESTLDAERQLQVLDRATYKKEISILTNDKGLHKPGGRRL